MKQQTLKFGSNCVGTKSHGYYQLFNGTRFEWYCGGTDKAVQLPTVKQKSDGFNIFFVMGLYLVSFTSSSAI